MGGLDVEKLLQPVSEETPCGDNLEYDSDFGALERAAEGKPGHVMGDKEIPPEPPKWDDVDDAAASLLARTKDLRIASHLAHAQLNLNGMPGFASGLELLNGLLQRYWKDVHPLLDEEDDNDPTLRMNSLAALNSRDGILNSLDRAILVSSRTLGRFSLRDIRLSRGEIAPQDDSEQPPDPTHIDAAFLDCDLEELTATASAADRCRDAIGGLDAFLREQVGAAYAPDFTDLKARLNEIGPILNEQLMRRGVVTEREAGQIATNGAGAPAALPGEIRSRDDAVRMLDRLCEFFSKNEPSSPVPLLLQRAKRLIAKDFMEILRELTPDGVSQAESIGGLNRNE